VHTLTSAFEVETPNQIQYCIQSFHLILNLTCQKNKLKSEKEFHFLAEIDGR